jgi:hypothetical protein
MLGRDDYWRIANALAKLPNTAEKYGVIMGLCEVLKADNPKFQAETFIEACE